MRFKDLAFVMTVAIHTASCAAHAQKPEDYREATLTPITRPAAAAPGVTPPDFKVAYVGDQGSTADSVRVLNLIKSEKTDLFVLTGDFDYKDSPASWEEMMNAGIGNMPVLAVIGNHDINRWDDYAAILKKRLSKMPDAHCSGVIGIKMRCEYKGLVFALSGVGTMGTGHEDFLKAALTERPALFKTCVWHKNQRLMQVGDKGDEVGWEPYQICLKEGAMVATAHEHSYERTFEMSSFEEQTVVHRNNAITLEPGKSLAFVSGLGGKSIRAEKNPAPWWAKVYTSTQKARPGVLFCSYFVDGDPRKARCYFRNIEGDVMDEFTLESRLPT